MPSIRTVRTVCCLALLSSAAVYGQGPTFEAVSIKVNRSAESRSSFRGSLSGISVTNQTAIDIIRNVWNVNRLQIVGGPSWAGEDRFDIEAKASGKASRDELVAMMKTMLAERFNLAVHQEMRPIPVYPSSSHGPTGDSGQRCGSRWPSATGPTRRHPARHLRNRRRRLTEWSFPHAGRTPDGDCSAPRESSSKRSRETWPARPAASSWTRPA